MGVTGGRGTAGAGPGRDLLYPAAQKVNSVKEREGGFDPDQYSFPPDPHQGHARGQGLARRDPRARRLMPANTGVLRRSQPAAPDETP